MAFKAIKLRQPQLILLDVFLSNNYDGLDLCKRLKSSTYCEYQTSEINNLLFLIMPGNRLRLFYTHSH